MNRQMVLLTTLASISALGVMALARRQQVSQLVSQTAENIPQEMWRDDIRKQIRATQEMVTETRDALEEAARASGKRAAGTLETGLDSARKAILTAIGTAIWTGVLAAFLIYVYAPERDQQERLRESANTVLEAIRNTLSSLMEKGEQLRGQERVA